jgi:thiamine biosynthesis lipoprotein
LTPSLDARFAVGQDSRHIYRTTAIGCLAEILVTEVDSLVCAIEILHEEVDRIDRAASRFRSDSEISHVQQSGGLPVKVSGCLFDAVSVALRVAELTDGAVDPTVGRALNALGYERDFAEVAHGVVGSLPDALPVPGWRSLELNQTTGTLRVPVGTLVDLGATAKALTADRIARRVFETLGCGVLVSLGGDISTAGEPPPGGFLVGLADVSGAADAPETVAIESGALATSGIASRQWKLGHHDVHHIVDPKTGLPPKLLWRTVTVAAATCVDANAATTGSVVKGVGAVEWLSTLRLPARLVAADGHIVRIAGWPAGDFAMSGQLVGRP